MKESHEVTNACAIKTRIKMPSNVEIKARVPSPADLLDRVKKICGSQEGTQLNQEDTFFVCPNGRLKLRIEQDGIGRLIFYKRSDISGPKMSDYRITIVNNPSDLKETLAQSLGVKGCVRKVRQLFMYGQTRIHIDNVEHLGSFMELEVVLRSDQTLSEGQAIADDLMEKLGIANNDLITCAYVDMLNKENNHCNN